MMPLPQERTSVFAVPHEVTRNKENAHGKTYRVRCSTRRCSIWMAALFVVFVRGFHIDCFRCLFFAVLPEPVPAPGLFSGVLRPLVRSFHRILLRSAYLIRTVMLLSKCYVQCMTIIAKTSKRSRISKR